MGTILAIGNDESLLIIRAALFRRMRAEVTAAKPVDAIQKLKTQRFDLVILCHTLSCEEMRFMTALAHEHKPKIRVLKIAAIAFPNVRAADVAADFESISEPYALVAKVTQLLAD